MFTSVLNQRHRTTGRSIGREAFMAWTQGVVKDYKSLSFSKADNGHLVA